MLLACNYSQPLLTLVGQGAVEIDLIKLSREDALAAELPRARLCRPVLLHTLGRAGAASPFHTDMSWEEFRDCLRQAGSPHVGLHLSLKPDDLDLDGRMDLRVQTAAERRAVFFRIVAGTMVARANMNVPLLLENVPYYGFRGAVRCVAEPGFIGAVLAETGAGFLLDLAHARVAADHLRMKAKDYIAALPLDRVREIHVSGPVFVAGQGLRDRHRELGEADYALLRWVLARTAPGIVTLEYNSRGEEGDSAALTRQLGRLRAIINDSASGFIPGRHIF